MQANTPGSTKVTKTHWFWDIAVLWPFIAVFLMLAMSTMTMFLNGSVLKDIAPLIIPLGILLYIGSIVLMIVVYVYAIHTLYTGTKLDNSQKKTWLVLVIMFNFITIPILHFMHLRKGE
ncbi:hypothetical protein KJ766_01450 [Patescibacteria group bacterium]|nr:hypothetical protein [Patescibacteria group bacterium]